MFETPSPRESALFPFVERLPPSTLPDCRFLITLPFLRARFSGALSPFSGLTLAQLRHKITERLSNPQASRLLLA
ncbi:MAG: hypothetical protein H6Q30_1847 [Bacteroidetes bacterium]|nr:hypothetical protein [Bacteroidota bacterium]